MPAKLPPSPSVQDFARTWAREMFAPAVKELAGRDGRVSATEVSKTEGLSGEQALVADDLRTVYEAYGASRPGVEGLIEAAEQYALTHASRVAGADGRISPQEAQQLSASLQADLQALQREPAAQRLDAQGYRFSQRVLDDVVAEYDIADPQALLDQAIARDGEGRYLNRTELEGAAKEMASPTPSTETEGPREQGFRWTPSVMARVMSAHGLHDEDALLMEAAKHDDGNRYLKRSELEAAAKVLSGQVVEVDVDLDAPEIAIISDIDKTIIPKHRGANVPAPYPGVSTLMRELEFARGGQAGDMHFVTARSQERVRDIPEYMEEHGVPGGPIETGTSTMPWLAQPEKVRDISRFMDEDPDQKFVLFGDTSHRDPEAYKEIIEKYGDRVQAAFIHRVNNASAERLEGLIAFEDYTEVAAILFQQGVLDEAAARRVMDAAQVEGLDITDTQIDELIATHQPG